MTNRNLAIMILCGFVAAAAVLLFLRLSTETAATAREVARLDSAVTALTTNMASLALSLDSLRELTPGLGEYMSTIQLHSAKLWYATGAKNWKLATYELDELGETIEAAERLHVLRNGVDISSVLRSVQATQLPPAKQSIGEGNLGAFRHAYSDLLAACNGCHRSAGYGFIHIIPPTREPVANQQWTQP